MKKVLIRLGGGRKFKIWMFFWQPNGTKILNTLNPNAHKSKFFLIEIRQQILSRQERKKSTNLIQADAKDWQETLKMNLLEDILDITCWHSILWENLRRESTKDSKITLSASIYLLPLFLFVMVGILLTSKLSKMNWSFNDRFLPFVFFIVGNFVAKYIPVRKCSGTSSCLN